MSLKQMQIEELQQAWREGMVEIEAYGVMYVSIAVHDITKEVALCMDADGRGPIYRVLKHSTEGDADALQAFVNAGGCSDDGSLLIPDTDLKE